MTKGVPREIKMDVLGFLCRKKLNECLFVNKKWDNLIESAKESELPQVQEIEMRCIDRQGEPFAVVFWNEDYTKRVVLVEGRDNKEIFVLKNCIVADYSFQGTFRVFEARFRRIVALVGQKVPFKQFGYDSTDRPTEELNSLARFREAYSGLFFTLNN